jgi:hypothetical protein
VVCHGGPSRDDGSDDGEMDEKKKYEMDEK